MLRILPLLLIITLPSCKEDDSEAAATLPPTTYTFASRFVDGEQSVSYSGQIFRHLLIHDLDAEIAGLTEALDEGSLIPTEGEVRDRLLFFFDFDAEVAGELPHNVSTEPAASQTAYGEVSSKDLRGKLAGNDALGQHREWNTDGVTGWTPGVTPTELVVSWMETLDALAVDRANGVVPMDPMGQPITAVHVTAEGLNLRQLTQKFLLGAIAWSQAADDYLDDDEADKGLLADNTVAVEGKPYTELEHAWDEGFGYFGAARTYGDYTDEQIADARYADADEDGSIDLLSEYSWGHSVNASKRDHGAKVVTDYSAGAFEAFLAGRHAIAEGADVETIAAHRDAVLWNWERAIAATVVHYINDVLQDMSAVDYDFYAHAKHFSELKGFALSLQFNRRSPLSPSDFARFHELVGLRPALPGSEDFGAPYAGRLVEARDLLQAAYDFDAGNMGDADGEGGW